MVNQERVNNGLPELTWDSDMASYSDQACNGNQLQILATILQVEKWSVGENIGQRICKIASAVVSGWMNCEVMDIKLIY